MKTTNTPKERPILFSGPMVRAILDGRKTQTRRIVKPKHEPTGFWGRFPHEGEERLFSRQELAPAGAKPWWEVGGINGAEEYNPYGQPGDRLWVKETFQDICNVKGDGGAKFFSASNPSKFVYAADGPKPFNGHWKPSIFMPRWASRITLEITAVRVERLKDITEADAIAEGLEILPGYDKPTYQLYGKGNEDNCSSNARKAYSFLWESINGPESWSANPWVWVVEFRKL